MTIGNNRPEKYIEAGVIVSLHLQEAVCNFIIENYCQGVVLDEDNYAGRVEIRFYVRVNGHTEFKRELSDYINKISAGESFQEEDIRTRVIENISWEDAYKSTIKPIIVDCVVIRPPWVTTPYRNKLELIIEPKMAFGTGSHETTRLCIREILKYFKPGQTFFDLGCGSAILSILAAKLGASFARGVDIDPVAVETAKENVTINDVSDRVEIENGSIESAEPDTPYDFLVANLIKTTIIRLYDEIDSSVKPGGIIVLSGLLAADQDSIVKMIERHEILKYDINRDGEWIAVTIIKK